MTLDVTCKKCATPFFIEHEPNEWISEFFVRNAAVCDRCKDQEKTPERPAPVAAAMPANRTLHEQSLWADRSLPPEK